MVSIKNAKLPSNLYIVAQVTVPLELDRHDSGRYAHCSSPTFIPLSTIPPVPGSSYRVLQSRHKLFRHDMTDFKKSRMFLSREETERPVSTNA